MELQTPCVYDKVAKTLVENFNNSPTHLYSEVGKTVL